MEKIRLLLGVVVIALVLALYANAGAVFGNLAAITLTAQEAPVRFVAGSNAGADYITVSVGTNETTANIDLTTFPVPKAWYLDFIRLHNYDTAKTFNVGVAVTLDPAQYNGKVSDLIIYLIDPATSTTVATLTVYQGGVFQGTGNVVWSGYVATLAPGDELRIDIYVSFYDGAVYTNDQFPLSITAYWSTTTEEPPSP